MNIVWGLRRNKDWKFELLRFFYVLISNLPESLVSRIQNINLKTRNIQILSMIKISLNKYSLTQDYIS